MDIQALYYSYRANRLRLLEIGVICLVLFGIAFLDFGTELNIFDSIASLYNYLSTGSFSVEHARAEKVIWLLRLPRTVLAALAGVGLAIAGLMMQTVTRNYVVSPFTMGVSSSAAFGASLCIVFGGKTIIFNDFAIVSSAFLFSMGSVFCVFAISKRLSIGNNSVIYIGIASNYLFAALTASLQYYAQANLLANVVKWTFGSFSKANWEMVTIVGAVVLACYVYSQTMLLKWNAFASNTDEMCLSLGIVPESLKRKTIVISVVLTATIISFTGVIGFVGLVAPHIARFIVGNEQKVLFPMTAVTGAGLLLTADFVSKFALYPVDVPVGIVVSFIGVPLFVHLILKSKSGNF